MDDPLHDARQAILRAQESINTAKLLLDEGRLAGAVFALENGSASLHKASESVTAARMPTTKFHL
jgi:hypothetical protein